MTRVEFFVPDVNQLDWKRGQDLVLELPIGTGTARRHYTIRDIDAAKRILTIDFVAHGHGASAEWLRAAREDSAIDAAGPRGHTYVRPADWHSAPFARLQALPTGARAVTEWSNRDRAWADIAAGIRRVASDAKVITASDDELDLATGTDEAAARAVARLSPEERAEFAKLIGLGFVDSFRQFEQPEKIFTWWDYRMLAFRRNAGLRIDHILLSPALAATCSHCEVDKTPRKWDQPSDHAPVIAQIGQ